MAAQAAAAPPASDGDGLPGEPWVSIDLDTAGGELGGERKDTAAAAPVPCRTPECHAIGTPVQWDDSRLMSVLQMQMNQAVGRMDIMDKQVERVSYILQQIEVQQAAQEAANRESQAYMMAQFSQLFSLLSGVVTEQHQHRQQLLQLMGQDDGVQAKTKPSRPGPRERQRLREIEASKASCDATEQPPVGGLANLGHEQAKAAEDSTLAHDGEKPTVSEVLVPGSEFGHAETIAVATAALPKGLPTGSTSIGSGPGEPEVVALVAAAASGKVPWCWRWLFLAALVLTALPFFMHEVDYKSGTFTYADGSIYEGSVRNGIREGRGKYTHPNGAIYEGDFKNDKREGRGKLTHPNGTNYEGDFKNDKKEGRGKYTPPAGGIYEGDFKNDKGEGRGKWTRSSGAIYEGDFKNDKGEGRGNLTYPDGAIYEGDFKNGKREGHGKLTHPDGTIYEGDFKNDKREGRGKLTYPDGGIYEGDFKNGKREGRGK